MEEEKSSPLFPPTVHESAILEDLGYAQELKRTFSFVGMLGFAFSIVTSWTALGGVLVVGIESGGPPVMIWSWLAICVLSLAVAGSMAEICSAYPVAGGQYSWVMILAPRSVARGMSFVTGWFMLTGILAMGATNNFISANFVLGMAQLSFPDYVIEQWHVVLVTYCIAISVTLANLGATSQLEKCSRVMIVWNIASFVIVVITILACSEQKASASFVFAEFQNLTGWSSGMAAILGVLQAAFGMCCYDAPAHMTEEMISATTEAPKAILLSVAIGGVTGFVFLIAICFSITDFDSVASTPTGVPLLQIFYSSTSSVPGTCILASLLVVIYLMCALFIMAESSRELYAFARDKGLPFSSAFSKVSGKQGVPVNAVLLACGVQMALNSIYFGSVQGFNTVIAIATEGFYLSYAAALFALLLYRWTNRSPSSSHSRHLLTGPYSLGRWSLPFNIIGLVFLLFTSITFNLPGYAPVTASNMNYISAAIGVIGAIAGITWIVDGRKRFTGPRVEIGREESGGREVGMSEAVEAVEKVVGGGMDGKAGRDGDRRKDEEEVMKEIEKDTGE